jgi:hypothetical protein
MIQRLRSALRNQGLLILLIVPLSFLFAEGGCGSSNGNVRMTFSNISPVSGETISSSDDIEITVSYSVPGNGEIYAGWWDSDPDDPGTCVDTSHLASQPAGYLLPLDWDGDGWGYPVTGSGTVTFKFTPEMMRPCEEYYPYGYVGPFDFYMAIATVDGKSAKEYKVASWNIIGIIPVP